ncbi:MAG: M42 family peptidase [Methanobacteriota archaeon]|nr:MAG: M42 family peptidase [Euryarchaeota archaeon]
MDVELLKKLCLANGIANNEEEVAAILEEEFKKAGLNVERDEFGNVIAYKKLEGKPIVLAAHMDEIGMMVKYIDEKGFIRFIKIGGIDNRTLVNQHIRIKTEKGYVDGIIGNKPPHIMKDEEFKKVIEYDEMFIDIGAKSREEVEKLGIGIGSPVFFKAPFEELLNNRVCGKALDDRIGCYMLIKIAKDLPDNVVLLGTAQEEVSTFGKGATVATYTLEPSYFIAVDTGVAGDHATVSEEQAPIALEKGPAITLVEASGRGNMADKRLASKIMEIAKNAGISYQLEAIEGGATDAASAYNVRGGVPSIAISIPTRYIHSNVSVASLKDIEEGTKLIAKIAKELK